MVAGGATYTGASGNLIISGTAVSTSAAVTVGAGVLTVSGNGALPNIAAVNAVQTIAMTKVASGTFQLTFNGQTTAPITYTNTAPGTATAAAIQSALQLLPAIGANVIVTALPASGANNQYFTVTFIGALGGAPQPTMTILNSGPLTASANVVRLSVSTITPGSAGLTINTGGTVTLDNTGVNSNARINSAATIALDGGTLNFNGNSAAGSSQALGAVTLASGASTIDITTGGTQTAVLNLASLTRNAGATVNFVVANSQVLGVNAQVIVAGGLAALTTSSVIAGATVTDASPTNGGFNLASTLVGNSVVPLTTYTTPTDHGRRQPQHQLRRYDHDCALAGNFNANALLIVGDGIIVSAPANSTLALTSGVIASSGGNTIGDTISVPTLALGAAEGIVTTYANSSTAATSAANLTISSVITGSNGLTISGPTTATSANVGVLSLTNANNYSGTTSLNSGTLNLGINNAIPGSFAAITGATGAGVSPIVITTTSTTGLQTGQTVMISGVLGATAANGSWVITVLNSTTFQLNNSTGNATYTSGGTWSNDPVNINGGTLQASTAVTLPNAVTLNNAALTIAGSNSIVFSGTFNLSGFNDTLNVTSSAPTVITGLIQDAVTNPAHAFSKMGGRRLDADRGQYLHRADQYPGRGRQHPECRRARPRRQQYGGGQCQQRQYGAGRDGSPLRHPDRVRRHPPTSGGHQQHRTDHAGRRYARKPERRQRPQRRHQPQYIQHRARGRGASLRF